MSVTQASHNTALTCERAPRTRCPAFRRTARFSRRHRDARFTMSVLFVAASDTSDAVIGSRESRRGLPVLVTRAELPASTDPSCWWWLLGADITPAVQSRPVGRARLADPRRCPGSQNLARECTHPQSGRGRVLRKFSDPWCLTRVSGEESEGSCVLTRGAAFRELDARLAKPGTVSDDHRIARLQKPAEEPRGVVP